jgi:hypothetical protein
MKLIILSKLKVLVQDMEITSGGAWTGKEWGTI